jgi:hypothetical protein
MLVTFSLPKFNLKKQMCSSWEFHVDHLYESSSTYDMVIGQDLLGKSRLCMNFNDQTVIWDTDTIPMKDRDTNTLSSEALIEVYIYTNEPQKLRDE